MNIKFKKLYLLGFSALTPTVLLANPATGQSYTYLVNIFIGLAVVVLIAFVLIIGKSLKSLQESSHQQTRNGGVWINQKLYDFDADQLKVLIKKINKEGKND